MALSIWIGIPQASSEVARVDVLRRAKPQDNWTHCLHHRFYLTLSIF
ncbi:uncharacterized protein ARMOST_10192 [Armillaria ostoyae]|uniref:Uncharacterized protein n=1 Tax=Armillaria ostoyae TaxID=47428 RepID=A0A284RDL6_ARMOS|nr:uncharacterized protein ARMOST_10192 [Armillaria ostoyae]